MRRLAALLLLALISPAAAQTLGSGNLSAGSITATGSTTARTLAVRAAEVVNIRDFGAVCDGTTSDRTAINAAMTAASAGNVKTVYFPPSATACMMSSNVTIPASVTLWAYPNTVTLKPTAGNVSNPVLLVMGNNTLVYGLSIDGGGQDFGTANNVITAFTKTNAVLDHVSVAHTRGIAYLLSTSIVNSGVRDSSFTDAGNHWKTTALAADRIQAIAFCCGTMANNHGNFVVRTSLTDVGLDAISIGSNTDFIAESNTCNLDNGQTTFVWTNPQPTAGQACVYSATNGTLALRNNRISGSSASGIDTLDAGYALLEGNTVTNAGGAGLGVFGTTSATVVGNILKNNAQWPARSYKAGISLSGALGTVIVSGNIATDDQTPKTQLYGIEGIAGSTFDSLRIDPDNQFDGNLTGPFGGLVNGYSYANTKDNRIINPCFAIDSPNEGAVYGGGGGTRKLMEGWTSIESNNRTSKIRSTATVLPGCGASSLLLTVTIAGAPAAGDFSQLIHNIEGFDVQDLRYGLATARALVFDFCAQTSIAGTYTAAIRTITKSFLIPYDIAANTMTCYSNIVPGDAAGAIANSSAYGFQAVFDFGSGSNQQSSTVNAWIAGANWSQTPTATVFGNQIAGNTFNIGAVRLYPGTLDVGWSQRTRAEERILTVRRYRKTFPSGTAVAQSAGIAGTLCAQNPIAVGNPSGFWGWGETMRVAPTITTYNPSAANANWRDVTAAADVAVSLDPATALSASTGVLIGTGATVATLGDALCIHATADAR